MIHRGVRVTILTTMEKICSRIYEFRKRVIVERGGIRRKQSTYRLIDRDTRGNDKVVCVDETMKLSLNQSIEVWYK